MSGFVSGDNNRREFGFATPRARRRSPGRVATEARGVSASPIVDEARHCGPTGAWSGAHVFAGRASDRSLRGVRRGDIFPDLGRRPLRHGCRGLGGSIRPTCGRGRGCHRRGLPGRTCWRAGRRTTQGTGSLGQDERGAQTNRRRVRSPTAWMAAGFRPQRASRMVWDTFWASSVARREYEALDVAVEDLLEDGSRAAARVRWRGVRSSTARPATNGRHRRALAAPFFQSLESRSRRVTTIPGGH